MDKKGFTLIELLMSIAIIAILASLMMGWIGSARTKSEDSKAISEMQNVQKALQLYYEYNGHYPNETPVGAYPYADNFNNMAGQLVSGGFLADVPVAPAGHTYSYYNYRDSNAGALIKTNLNSYPASSLYPGSCRPFSSGSQPWCTGDSNQDFCLCSPY